MSQPDDVANTPGPDEAMTAARSGALIGIVLAVLSLQGQGSWTLAVQSIFGLRFGPDQLGLVMTLSGLVTLGLSVTGFVLGRRAMAVPTSAASWEQYVGRAAVVLGALGAVIAVVTVVGGLLAPSATGLGPLM
jgi:hypothetical protein